MKQQRCTYSSLTHSLLMLLMSLLVLSAMLTGFLTGVAKSAGGKVGGESPPAPTSSRSSHEASGFPGHG
ncbi:hypothetical protein QOZ80_1AG0007160 [Eleusine coracana subsp. coracana]|nr:hypothetical protein QOZ80_1AG0007160 [Eleusine coracana subsp. coracana]